MTEVVGRSPIVVIGVGNRLRSDDGVGPAVVERLSDLEPGLVDRFVFDGEATRLVAAWDQRALAVVVDAVVSGAPPGTVHCVDDPDRLGPRSRAVSSHAAGLAEAVALGRALQRMPERLVVLGVEAEVLSHGPVLSEPVRTAVPELVQWIRSTVGEVVAAR